MDWTVKYMPKSFDEVAGNKEVIEALKQYIKNPLSMPHLLFHGTAGTGKTTLAILLAKEMFKENWKMNFKEMNASDDRGIEAIRNRVIKYMKETGLSRFNGCPFKILFLDEADAITPEAQACLKRPLEIYKHNCRVIFSCNNINKIIPEIQDRCAIFKFGRLSKQDIITRLKQVAKAEGLNAVNFEEIYDECRGSMRKALILLQQKSVIKKKSFLSYLEGI